MFNKNNDRIRILVADDHKLIRVGLKNSLDKNPDMIVVAEAECGKDALMKFKSHDIDVVVIDLVLGDMQGVEVIRRMLEIKPTAGIIALTSELRDTDVINCIQTGVLAFVLKDINSDMLSTVVRNVAEGSMWIDNRAVKVLKSSKATFLGTKNCSRANFRARHNNLTEREYEVLKLVVEGKSNHEIANELCISEHTSKAHVCSIIQKLVVDDRTQAAVKALKEGLV